MKREVGAGAVPAGLSASLVDSVTRALYRICAPQSRGGSRGHLNGEREEEHQRRSMSRPRRFQVVPMIRSSESSARRTISASSAYLLSCVQLRQSMRAEDPCLEEDVRRSSHPASRLSSWKDSQHSPAPSESSMFAGLRCEYTVTSVAGLQSLGYPPAFNSCGYGCLSTSNHPYVIITTLAATSRPSSLHEGKQRQGMDDTWLAPGAPDVRFTSESKTSRRGWQPPPIPPPSLGSSGRHARDGTGVTPCSGP